MKARLGVDIGGVIIQRTDESDDTSFWGDNFLATPTVPGAFEALRRLHDDRFGDDLFVISKSGADTEARARAWFRHHAFFERTAIRPANLLFCRRREDKGPITDQLGITHFVDDRLEVLSYLDDVPHRYLFKPRDQEVAEFSQALSAVQRVDSWKALLAALGPGA